MRVGSGAGRGQPDVAIFPPPFSFNGGIVAGILGPRRRDPRSNPAVWPSWWDLQLPRKKSGFRNKAALRSACPIICPQAQWQSGWYTELSLNQITQILAALEQGKPQAAQDLLPLVYEELRKLAAQRLAEEKPGQTLQATALVHEAFLRLVDVDHPQDWNGRGHFFAAAAEAMRRILVENARRKHRSRHGGERRRVDLTEAATLSDSADGGDELLELNEALTRLEASDPQAAQLVKLRFFAGLTMSQAADAIGIPLRTAGREWTYARAWLHRAVSGD